MAVRAPPKRAPPAAAAATTTGTETLETWISKRARKMVLNRLFSLELEMGLINDSELESYKDLDIALVQSEIKDVRLEIEMYKLDYGASFEQALEEAVRTKNYLFDFFLWVDQKREALEEFRDKEIVYFRKRTTAFTLEKPCPNCGKKELIAEAAVFTRAADEAVDQFATCKNCSARYRLQAVL